MPKYKKDFLKFHGENGNRVVVGTFGPVPNVEMLLKKGYRHVYMSRHFAKRHGLIPLEVAPGYLGYGGLVNMGQIPIKLGTKTTTHTVYLAEENQFDVVLGRSFMEARRVQTDPNDLSSVVCQDNGDSLDCRIIVIRDGTGDFVTFSPAVLAQLSQNLEATTTSPEREESLDRHVRERIHAEILKLKEEEEEVKMALRTALEKENLGREKALSGGDKDDGDLESKNAGSRGTYSLREDIEAVKRRVEKYTQRKELGVDASIEESRKALVQCYRENSKRPLDCWREVEEFKKQVASIEGRFVDSLK
ncbi:hypothetical protein FRC17_004233 [Serendipita sp. 399]|nr:hypothetical protein FRC17_004233 [Serendipita sp. 399]